jgi:threonine synthase
MADTAKKIKEEKIFSPYLSHLSCPSCQKQYDPAALDYVCPAHGKNNRVEVIYDYAAIDKAWSKKSLATNTDRTIRRYAPLLPINEEVLHSIPYHVGGTPLIRAKNTQRALGLDNVYIKFDSANPSASLKDRASFMVTAIAKAQNRPVIAAASSGNAAASLAAVCAAANMQAVLFVPKAIPQVKLAQIAIYGATVFVVDGSYDQACALCEQACDEFGWYSRNTGFNPYTREGKKTVSFEIAEQLGWHSPDWIFVPVGDGCILSGIEKGFRDLKNLGWIKTMPRIVAIQAENAPALYQAWKNGRDVPQFVEARSSVDSINVGLPGDGALALRAVKDTNGLCMTLSDEEMKEAMKTLAAREGLLGCMAGSSAVRALEVLNQKGQIAKEDTVVLLNTGHGLKDLQNHENTPFPNVISVQPALNSLKRTLKNEGLNI